MGFAVLSGVMYGATTAKWVDFSETQLQFTNTRSAYVASSNVSPLAGGGLSFEITWRFANSGRLPLTVAIFQFTVYLDNGSDPRSVLDTEKLSTEVTRTLSFQESQLTGLTVAPSGTADRTWWVNVTLPGELADIHPSPADGRYYLAFTDASAYYFIADVDQRQMASVGVSSVRVGP